MATLAVEARAGIEIEEFERWMATEQRRINLLCLRIVQNREDADHLTQDAFLKAYQALQRGATAEEPAKWITRIAVNTCLDHLRSRRWQFWKRTQSGEDGAAALTLAPDAGPDPESLLLSQQIGKRIAAALEKLSDRQRSVFVLRHYEDRPLDEIGEILGMNTGTVKAHLFRALGHLRNDLQDLYGK